jgi:hypothetical protein
MMGPGPSPGPSSFARVPRARAQTKMMTSRKAKRRAARRARRARAAAARALVLRRHVRARYDHGAVIVSVRADGTASTRTIDRGAVHARAVEARRHETALRVLQERTRAEHARSVAARERERELSRARSPGRRRDLPPPPTPTPPTTTKNPYRRAARDASRDAIAAGRALERSVERAADRLLRSPACERDLCARTRAQICAAMRDVWTALDVDREARAPASVVALSSSSWTRNSGYSVLYPRARVVSRRGGAHARLVALAARAAREWLAGAWPLHLGAHHAHDTQYTLCLLRERARELHRAYAERAARAARDALDSLPLALPLPVASRCSSRTDGSTTDGTALAGPAPASRC